MASPQETLREVIEYVQASAPKFVGPCSCWFSAGGPNTSSSDSSVGRSHAGSSDPA